MVSIVFGAMQVNQFRNNASLNQGKNTSPGWSFYTKSNIPVGQIAGNMNIVLSGANILIDPDMVDNNIPNAGGQANPNLAGNTEVF